MPQGDKKEEEEEEEEGDDDDELAHGWRPPRGGKRAQRDNYRETTTLKLIVICVAEIQN